MSDSMSIKIPLRWLWPKKVGREKSGVLEPSATTCTPLEKLLQHLRQSHGISNRQFRVVYEAGPCGFVLYRRLRQLRVDCAVIAPSLIPKRPGTKSKPTNAMP